MKSSCFSNEERDDIITCHQINGGTKINSIVGKNILNDNFETTGT